MKSRCAASPVGLFLLGGFLVAGCSQQENRPFSILDPFGLAREIFGVGKTPVRMGITLVHTNRMAAAPWAPLQSQMQRSLNQPVQFEPLKPFQIKAHLASGRLQFAMVRVEEESQVLSGPEVGRAIAAPIFEEGANEERGLLVTAADSEIHSIAELKGKRIAFGPIGDPVTHVAALKMLEKAGISPDSIPRELLPIPGTLRHHLNSFESAKAVIYERPLGIAAGFVRQKDYDKWPDTGGSLLLLRISKDQLRILGRTAAVLNLPDGAVLASAKADPELVSRVKTFLMEELPTKRSLCARLGLVRYETVALEARAADIPEAQTATHN